MVVFLTEAVAVVEAAGNELKSKKSNKNQNHTKR